MKSRFDDGLNRFSNVIFDGSDARNVREEVVQDQLLRVRGRRDVGRTQFEGLRWNFRGLEGDGGFGVSTKE